jgi:hypothetical protein
LDNGKYAEEDVGFASIVDSSVTKMLLLGDNFSRGTLFLVSASAKVEIGKMLSAYEFNAVKA